MARSLSVIVLLAALGGAAAIYFAFGRPKAAPPDNTQAELSVVAASIEGDLKAAASAVEGRADTLAGLPVIKNAIPTSPETLKDLGTQELNIQVSPGETIVIGRLVKPGNEQETLLQLPAGASSLTPDLSSVGTMMMPAGKDKLAIARVAEVIPPQDAEKYAGRVAVIRQIDVSPIKARLAKLPMPVRVDFGDHPLIDGERVPAAGANVVSVPVTAQMSSSVTLVGEAPAVVAQPSSTGALGGAGGLALVGVIAAVLLWRAKKPAVAPPVIDVARAPTELSAPGRPAVAPQPGSASPRGQFGRYALAQQLGSGGMAQVFMARVSGEAGFEKRVALKIMHAELSSDQKAVGLFLDEARLVSRLNHPNIVQITDLGREGNEYFIAMEYVDGADLDRLLALERARGSFVPLREAFTIVRKVCDGLHAAHEARAEDGHPLDLVHRDVKAENVLISRSGAVKVGDFGIAKANQQVHKTTLGELKGTAAYMAPEHRTGQPVDRRADLYGVGAIAYRVFTGAEVNLDLAMLAHLGKQGWPHLAPPSQLRPELPTALDRVIFKALAFDREDRYPTLEALEEAFAEIASTLSLSPNDKGVAQWVDGLLGPVTAASASTTVPQQAG